MVRSPKDCIARVSEAFDGLYSEKDVLETLDGLNNFLNIKDTAAAELEKFLNKRLVDLEMEEALRKKNIVTDRLKLNSNIKKFANLKSATDFNVRMRNFADKIGKGVEVAQNDFMSKFLGILRKDKLDDLIVDLKKGGKGIDNEMLSNYLHELNQSLELKPKPLDSIPEPHRKTYKLATAMGEMQRDFLQVKRDAGANVPFLKGRISRQQWNPHKIGRNIEGFKQALAKNVDWGKTSTIVEGKQLTREQWIDRFTEDTISGKFRDEFETDSFSVADLETPISAMERNTALTQALESKRNIAIKPSVWNSMMEEFGAGNTFETFLKELEQTARSDSMIRNLGTNPEKSWQLMLSEIGTQNKALGAGGKIFIDDKINAKMLDQLTGKADTPASKNMLDAILGSFGIDANTSEAVAFVGSSERLFFGSTKLGLSGISALSDPLVGALRASSIQGGGKFFKTQQVFYSKIAESLQEIAGQYGSKEAKRIAENEIKNLKDEFFVMAKANRFNEAFSSEFKPGVEGGLLAKTVNPVNKFHDFVFSLNPMVKWTEMRQIAADISIARDFGSMISEYGTFKKLPQHLQEFVREIGMEDIWDILTPHAQKFDDGGTYLVKDVVDRLTDDDIVKYIKAKGGQAGIDQARRELNLAVREIFALENSRRVLMPGVSTKATLNFGGQRGTFKGEVGYNMAQFKSFAVDLWLNNVTPAVQRNGLANTFGTYLPAATMLGMAQSVIRDVASGNKPRNFFDFSDEERAGQATKNWGGVVAFASGLPVFDGMIKTLSDQMAGESVDPRSATSSLLSGLLGPGNVEPLSTVIEGGTILFADDEEKKKKAAGRVITNAPVIGSALHGHILGRALKGNILNGFYSFFDEDHEEKLERFAERQGSERWF